MKLQAYSVAVALIAKTAAVKYTAPRGDTPPLDARDLSARSGNLFARQSYDYCGTTSYYCYGAECCGVTTYNCMPAGAECCASYSTYGYGLWCAAGTSCTVIGGYVQCENDAGDTFSADSSAAETTTRGFTSTSIDSDVTTTTDPIEGPTDASGSNRSSKSKKKSKAWIAGAVIGPLIGIAIIAAVVFFLFVVRKKQKANANAANASIIANQHGGGAGGQPVMASAPPMNPAPQMGAAPMAQHSDHKTPAYTQQYEVPTPISSPPPQWTPASPAPTTISPAPVYAQPLYSQQTSPQPFTNELHAQSASPMVSPMSTGNGGYGNAMELPTAPAAQPAKGGAQELHG